MHLFFNGPKRAEWNRSDPLTRCAGKKRDKVFLLMFYTITLHSSTVILHAIRHPNMSILTWNSKLWLLLSENDPKLPYRTLKSKVRNLPPLQAWIRMTFGLLRNPGQPLVFRWLYILSMWKTSGLGWQLSRCTPKMASLFPCDIITTKVLSDAACSSRFEKSLTALSIPCRDRLC